MSQHLLSSIVPGSKQQSLKSGVRASIQALRNGTWVLIRWPLLLCQALLLESTLCLEVYWLSLGGEWACLLSLSSSPLLVQCCFAFFLLLMSLQNLVMSGGHPSGCLECTTVWTRIASVFSKDRCDSVNAAPVSIPPLTWPLHLLGGFQVP